jgi:acyl carrier protein
MNRRAIRDAIVTALKSVAPEADTSSLDEAERLRDALDLDSMDFLNFVIALHEGLHVDIPEIDYPKMQTLADAVDYLEHRLPTSP